MPENSGGWVPRTVRAGDKAGSQPAGQDVTTYDEGESLAVPAGADEEYRPPPPSSSEGGK